MLPPIGELLIKDRFITQKQLNHCVESKKIHPKDRLGSILKGHGFISDIDLASVLSKQIGWRFFQGEYVPDFKIVEHIGLDFLSRHQVFPLKNGSKPSFVVSFVDDVETTDFLNGHFGNDKVNFYIGSENDIRNALDLIVQEKNRQKLLSEIENFQLAGIESLADWLNSILSLAVITNSTDVHIEPTGKAINIRFRIDGLLETIGCLKQEYISTIANILLTKCNGNPSDYRIQDGRFNHDFKGIVRTFDIRFNQIPTMHGPGIVLRLLDRSRGTRNIESLGYLEHNRKLINQAIKIPNGIILITGPTGSGKTTTLSAIINELKSIDKKICTVEDPIECTHTLVSQVEVDQDKNLSFRSALRAFLRQDPDVILIGEIRDQETSEEAFLAAQTGVQIFSTLHTKDPISGIIRLKDLGVPAVNIAMGLTAIVSQRLVRKLCPFCKNTQVAIRQQLEPNEAKYLIHEEQVIYKAVGCKDCRYTGYLGRTVVAEVLLIDPEIRELVGKNALGEIYALLRQRGTYQTMVDDMKSLILKFETSMEEAVRVLG